MTSVKRSDIELEEQVMYYTSLTEYGMDPESISWRATLDGDLSTGERVTMAREGQTAVGAMKALEEAIAKQGWEIE